MWRDAVILRGDPFSDFRRHVDGAMREICDGFDARWDKERVGGEVPVVTVVCRDRGEVVSGTVVEGRVSDAWDGIDEIFISWDCAMTLER